MIGKLTITVHRAEGLKSTHILTKQNPCKHNARNVSNHANQMWCCGLRASALKQKFIKTAAIEANVSVVVTCSEY